MSGWKAWQCICEGFVVGDKEKKKHELSQSSKNVNAECHAGQHGI